MRVLHWFGPCIWGEDSGYAVIKSFWHRTAIGRALTERFWNAIGSDVIGLMGFDKDPEIGKLKPTCDAMTTGCTFSILNYETDFFEPIRNGTVRIHLADISHLSEGKVHLDDSDGTVLESNAMLCVTGWKHSPPLKFLPEGIEKRIGLPYSRSAEDAALSPDESLAAQANLVAQADAEIQQLFPGLKVPPKFNPNYVPLADTKAFKFANGETQASAISQTPFMLYRFMVPGTADFLRSKDLAFAGAIMNFSNVICAHAQGLWISAYFDGKLARDPSSAVLDSDGVDGHLVANGSILTLNQVHYQTILHNRFGKWRYPNDPGSRYPDFVFEAVPYLDMMMADMGLRVHRKTGWFKEIVDPYGPEDYSDINDEWNAKFCKD
ncbi:flavin-binding monooxygenase-like family protein [Purpureocillium lilacinum]|uniref:Flavin-binding monooxygenase-like family protein n=2 Tax=Purpureocillium lilacinum TaxID=33203 RepID=A0A179HL00_PURLI|nr:flavin-binding monooxygenase-like family protein [Purpureocillium lilacinum]KAK4083220.1 hypothetical protein Purlil1_10790 [Purpureocillium lilacinum]OAQ88096.1 flavin-binding monooxygenase-like family protein [Purpureocillium lilacinum]OAQ90149.1 flavin-binding monooxygenase-like family protein [Purpureocillium lilacinum]PWI66905.1 hypothetical protein PCL_04749 [Purpureocillium lilacinum]GJN69802.1 hypothetical protein PLICBS_003854 [Purpureocillium lilacinum]